MSDKLTVEWKCPKCKHINIRFKRSYGYCAKCLTLEPRIFKNNPGLKELLDDFAKYFWEEYKTANEYVHGKSKP
ncbi:MAG: hypothetical protein PHQ35_11110 [Phycisphaerae bacterium]|nr:hypothetical protein [Phycisphaerae bacterium]